MKANIVDKSYELFPLCKGNIEDDINATKRWIFQQGAIEGEKEIIERLHKALKALRLDKHSIALNVLKIAGIELPNNK
jgi:hypothetical protein